MKAIILKADRNKVTTRRHPWIFSGAVASVKGNPQSGETVAVLTSDGDFFARGAYSPKSQLTTRIWSFDPHQAIDSDFFQKRLADAISRRLLLTAQTDANAWRLVNAESDGLPGLIVDQYGNYLVCQFLSAGAEYWKAIIVEHLKQLFPGADIYERSDADVRAKEDLPPRTGALAGGEPPAVIEIQQNGARFAVDLKQGHKTGFYLDQRENHRLSAQYLNGVHLLNCFAYTGAFAVTALQAGAAKVTNIESSASALALMQRHLELNQLSEGLIENVSGDVFSVLRRYRDARQEFDAVLMDPPKFADSRKNLERACRGYKDINLLALKLLKPGGVLITFSCSSLVSRELFQQIVAGAALDAGRDVQIVKWLSQAADHPVSLHFPEGFYLKGLICRVSD